MDHLKIVLRVLAVVGIVTVMAFSGPSNSTWRYYGGTTSTISAAGSYTLYTGDGSAAYLNPFTVLVSTSSASDSVRAYLADERGTVQSDTLTINGVGSGYMAAGGIPRHWVLTGSWRLVILKAVGSISAVVSQ